MSFERDNIRRMTGYTSGEQPLDPGTIKLNTNENPYPPSPGVQAALSNIDAASLRRYPSPEASAFVETAASLHGVEPGNIIATRGGDELLRLVITTFVDPRDTIAMSDPTMLALPGVGADSGARTLKIPREEDWRLPEDFARQANAAGAKLTFIVNPHAPSGTLESCGRIAEFAHELDGLLLLDEAYVDFVEPAQCHNSIPLVRELDNVIILRSLSKGYALAGLRFGYGIGPASLIDPMRSKTRDSYNLDAISHQLSAAALADQDYASQTWQRIRVERERVGAALAELDMTAPPSETNFLLVSVPETLPSARNLYEGLEADGILVRYFADDRLADKLRMTIGTPDENDRLLRSLRQLAK
ncbi:MAG: aminotransferase class I/II-fold pyridoxal phosphate-dependent enzyme [Gammaproteobacteria bacterium]|nr:aminotransferase class I/II-fold pyridoxal phosphate-dependent enzyme [Gammaproteobacteria bacterium]